MWKKFIISMAINMAFDEIILALERISRKSTSSIDNKMVQLLKAEKDDIIHDVKSRL